MRRGKNEGGRRKGVRKQTRREKWFLGGEDVSKSVIYLRGMREWFSEIKKRGGKKKKRGDSLLRKEGEELIREGGERVREERGWKKRLSNILEKTKQRRGKLKIEEKKI